MKRVAAGWPTVALIMIGALQLFAGAAAFEPLPRAEPEDLGIDPAGIARFLNELESQLSGPSLRGLSL